MTGAKATSEQVSATTPKKLTRENAIARRKKAPPHGMSLMALVKELETEHPDLAADAPVSSAALEAGELVRSARLAADKSQRELAEMAGLHQSAVSTIERGEGKDGPTYRKLRDVAEALGLRIAFLPKTNTVDATTPDLLSRDQQVWSVFKRLSYELVSQEDSPALAADLAEGANVFLIGPYGVVRERSMRANRYRVGGGGRFIQGGRFIDQPTVSLAAGEEVDIVNTSDEVVVAVELPVTGVAAEER